MSPSRIEWVHLDSEAPGAVHVGDVVSAAAGGLPIYRIVALADRQAWVSDEAHAQVRLLPLGAMHWKMTPA
jgi:hypothetical protein